MKLSGIKPSRLQKHCDAIIERLSYPVGLPVVILYIVLVTIVFLILSLFVVVSIPFLAAYEQLYDYADADTPNFPVVKPEGEQE